MDKSGVGEGSEPQMVQTDVLSNLESLEEVDLLRRLLEISAPGSTGYLLGAMIMMLGVVLPVGYMMLRNKRVPISSIYGKHTNK